jgi:hypothetical protein
MRLARVVRMPSGTEEVPVVTVSPTSGFVSPVYGGLKPAGEVTWDAATLTAAEIGVVLWPPPSNWPARGIRSVRPWLGLDGDHEPHSSRVSVRISSGATDDRASDPKPAARLWRARDGAEPRPRYRRRRE